METHVECFLVQVGDVQTELGYWARPEDMTWARPSYKVTSRRPGSDIVANAAAALAAVSVAYQPYDSAYSKLALSNARNLYAFARDSQGLSTAAVPDLVKVRTRDTCCHDPGYVNWDVRRSMSYVYSFLGCVWFGLLLVDE
jgi:hypothetical protein